MRHRLLKLAILAALSCLPTSLSLRAQPLDITTNQSPVVPPVQSSPLAPPTPENNLLLGASFANDGQVIRSGLRWRIYPAAAPTTPIRTSDDAIPVLQLDPGEYVVHVAYGLASSTRKIVVGKQAKSERFALAAGGLTVHGTNGGAPIDPKDIKIAIYIPSPTNDEDKMVTGDLPSGEILRLPEGTYHIVTGYGSSNSTVVADIRVQTGKVTDVLVNHKAARVTLKLVSQAGSEAIANTAWTVLTPGGDVIREELSAFPTMVLAEGAYTAIARNDGKTFTGDFKVSGTNDQDVEILRQEAPRPDIVRPDQTPRREAVRVEQPRRTPFGKNPGDK
ncbi:MAG: hypothetical protein K2P80_07750 [Beijerinckiaceae bacterium]|nr:hypothetical protein [Beijerinckiaceae bacterium]